MIKINLLPSEPPKNVLKYDIATLISVLIAAVLVAGGIYYVNESEIETKRQAITQMKREIASLEQIFKEYTALEREKSEIQRRIKAMEGLKTGRALAARTLFDLGGITKEGIWLRSFKKTEAAFEIEGRSLENESISGFMEAISKVPYIKNVELRNVETVTEEGAEIKKFIIFGNIGL